MSNELLKDINMVNKYSELIYPDIEKRDHSIYLGTYKEYWDSDLDNSIYNIIIELSNSYNISEAISIELIERLKALKSDIKHVYKDTIVKTFNSLRSNHNGDIKYLHMNSICVLEEVSFNYYNSINNLIELVSKNNAYYIIKPIKNKIKQYIQIHNTKFSTSPCSNRSRTMFNMIMTILFHTKTHDITFAAIKNKSFRASEYSKIYKDNTPQLKYEVEDIVTEKFLFNQLVVNEDIVPLNENTLFDYIVKQLLGKLNLLFKTFNTIGTEYNEIVFKEDIVYTDNFVKTLYNSICFYINDNRSYYYYQD